MADTANPATWLEEHGDYLYRFAMSRLQNEELAEDMLQETLLAAWKGRERFKGDASVRTWLVSILKHKIIDHIRLEIKNRELAGNIENDPTSSYFNADGGWSEVPFAWKDNPEELCQNQEFRQVLEACASKLPARQRLVFHMRDVVGEDTDTVCKACDITPTHLHVLLHRARLGLRQCLEKNWFARGITR